MAKATRTRVLLFNALALSIACAGQRVVDASVPEPAPGQLLAPADYARSDRLLGAELRNAQGVSAADAIRQLRPHFLRANSRNGNAVSAAPAVYVNGQHVGGVDALDLIAIGMLIEVRHVDAVAAKSMFGSYCPCERGVILVQMRRTARGG
jgi:hypothetical protein